MKLHRAARSGFWIVRLVLKLAFATVFAGAGVFCLIAGLALIAGPITVYGDPRQPDTADRFQGLAAIGMGAIVIFATSQCIREWVAEGGERAAKAGLVPIVPQDDLPAGPAQAEAACRHTDGEGGSR